MASASGAGRLPAPLRRRQLLDVAARVFADHGFHATTMEEVARAAGVSKPVLYHHFSSKRALYRELLQDVGARLVEAIETAADAGHGPQAAVAGGFRAYMAFVDEQSAAFRLLFGSGARRDAEFQELVSLVEGRLAAVVAARIEAGLGPAHRRLLAEAIVGMAEAAGRHQLRRREEDRPDPEAPSPAEVAAWLTELTWSGLRGLAPDRTWSTTRGAPGTETADPALVDATRSSGVASSSAVHPVPPAAEERSQPG